MIIKLKNKDKLIVNDFIFKCCIGRKGLNKHKIEGDNCTPKGTFKIGDVYYRSDREILTTGDRPLVENLDDLPMPAWDLYDIEAYKKTSYLIAKFPPVTSAEFSRGCVFKCDL